MVNGININLFDFQEKAVIKLMDIVTDSRSKQTVIVKSPTGSGKTIILIDFIEEYLTKINSRTTLQRYKFIINLQAFFENISQNDSIF